MVLGLRFRVFVEVDGCMYTKLVYGECMILYEDDMLIFCTNLNIVRKTKCFLASKFDMKGISKTSIILGG